MGTSVEACVHRSCIAHEFSKRDALVHDARRQLNVSRGRMQHQQKRAIEEQLKMLRRLLFIQTLADLHEEIRKLLAQLEAKGRRLQTTTGEEEERQDDLF